MRVSATESTVKVVFNRALVTVLLYVLMLVSANHARASDFKNFRHRIFTEVKRVFVSVEESSYGVTPEQVPSVLKRDTLEKMLVDIYRERFSSANCKKWLGNRTPYSCEDQPVALVPENERSKYNYLMDTTFASRDELRDPGTLHVIFRISIHGNLQEYDPPLETPIATYQLIQYRPESDIPILWSAPQISIVPLSQSPGEVEARVVDYIRHRIK